MDELTPSSFHVLVFSWTSKGWSCHDQPIAVATKEKWLLSRKHSKGALTVVPSSSFGRLQRRCGWEGEWILKLKQMRLWEDGRMMTWHVILSSTTSDKPPVRLWGILDGKDIFPFLWVWWDTDKYVASTLDCPLVSKESDTPLGDVRWIDQRHRKYGTYSISFIGGRQALALLTEGDIVVGCDVHNRIGSRWEELVICEGGSHGSLS